MKPENLLLVADSERDADMLYTAGLMVGGPMVYVRHEGQAYLVAGDLDLARLRRVATRCRVVSMEQYLRRARRREVGEEGSLAAVVARLAEELHARKFLVPERFPYGLARKLRRYRIRVKTRPGALFFVERELKTPEEVRKISASLIMAEVGLSEAIHALRNSKVGPEGRLIYRSSPLTSERLRAIVQVAVLQAGGVTGPTVVACGRQAADPQEQGHGVLRANRPILLGVSPRSARTGYFADISRTVVRGRASEGVRRLYHAVQASQDAAFEVLRDGRAAREVHAAARARIEDLGYRTSRKNGHWEGLVHGVGHGLGLELQEPPRLAALSLASLRAGNVVTLAPGLYYAGLGGVRLKDVALVTRQGARNLTKFEKVLEI